ncbi:MAG: CBS domain-containing protein [Candidatus Helarchaeota archaeon]|nr:CBS domain-containing protein [Candidatus Helarchaeota archaeon]
MRISEIMEKNIRKISIDKDRLLIDAIEMMKKQNLSTLLCTNDDKLAGILTERELADRLGSSKSKSIKASSLHVSTSMYYKPKIVSPKTELSEAAEIMLKEEVSGLPVMEDDKPVGLITYNEMTQICQKLDKISLNKIMTKKPITISISDRLIHARNILFDKNVSVLPVLDGENLIGLISEGMIARAFANFRNKVPGRHQEERLRYILVADAMKTDPPTLKENDSIGDAAKLLLEEGMRAIPIINDNDKLIGIVSKTDMVKLVKNNLKID